MPESFKAKVRNVGTSLGVLIPKWIVEADKIRINDEVEVSLVRTLSKDGRKKMIKELFGWAKKTSGKKKLPTFERDRKDRLERYDI